MTDNTTEENMENHPDSLSYVDMVVASSERTNLDELYEEIEDNENTEV